MCCVLLTIYHPPLLPSAAVAPSSFHFLDSFSAVFFPLSLSLCSSNTLSFLSSVSCEAVKSRDGTRLTLNCLVQDQTQSSICIFKCQYATDCVMTLVLVFLLLMFERVTQDSFQTSWSFQQNGLDKKCCLIPTVYWV